jgi:4-amino-4-deoxy-L-arabinose transferase-like glycosyltransferase
MALPLAATEAVANPPNPVVPSRPPQFQRWWPALAVVLLSVLYFVPTCVRAAHAKLWYDEILTFDAATLLPSFKALWAFLGRFEASPPLGFVLSAVSESIFGWNEFGLRLPSIISFWIMALCMYRFLGRRLPRPYAIAGMLLPALTAAGGYSYEARPYALMLALAGIALLAWQAAAEGRGRPGSLVLIGIALSAALCSHSMAIALALPFLVGEATRTYQRKRLDWPVWCAFASAAPALLVIWAVKNGRNFAGIFRYNGSVSQNIFTTYAQILRPAVAPLVLAFVLLLVLRKRGTGSAKPEIGMPAHELAALVGFALIPFVAVPLSTLGGHYWIRYSMNCTIGLTGLLVLLLFKVGRGSRLSEVIVLVVLGVSFLLGQFLPADMRPDKGLRIVNSSDEIQPHLDEIPSDAPIVVSNGLTFVELEHYSTPKTAARLYYLTDRAAAESIDGDIAFEVDGWLLGRFFPFHANFADYHAFIATHKRFYVVRPIRNIVREYFAGRVNLLPRETSSHFQYFEVEVR